MVQRQQLGFMDAFTSPKLGRHEVLERIHGQVQWGPLEGIVAALEPEAAGRPPYDPLMMFKALLLARLYDLSDAALERELNNNLAFRRFLGLGLESDAPDHTTICRFRNRLVGAGLMDKLFAGFDRQLEEMRLILKRGTIIDATLLEAAAARPRGEEGEWRDVDARFAKKKGKSGSVYGYKAHIAMDQNSYLIRSAQLTPANVNDTEVAEELIRFDEEAVYADKAYAKAERRRMLKRLRIKDRIMHKSWGGGPKLSAWQRRQNRLIAPIRASVETVFAVFKQHMGYRRVGYVGLIKNRAELLLLALAYNMRRAAKLAAT